ncbi:hypothetical protein Y032_0383g378, partial [Ancylostoma ceylanicum]
MRRVEALAASSPPVAVILPSTAAQAFFLIATAGQEWQQLREGWQQLGRDAARISGRYLMLGARRAMDALVSRARRIGPLRSLSDPLLLALFANSDCIPDRVQQGVVLFNKGDRTSYWYLLLAGEVQLFLPGYYSTLESVPLCSLSAGSLFGELDIDRHCCSAIVTRQAEFVRISQRHFVSLYN